MAILVKPEFKYFRQYKEMMDEWIEDGSRLAPWPVYLKYDNEEKFKELVQYLEDVENGINSDGRAPSTTMWLYDEEQDKIIGLYNLRHVLIGDMGKLWGHIGYGVRPSERRKGYATFLLKSTMNAACERGINDVYVGAYSDNIASCKTIEKCGFQFDEVMIDEGCGKEIRKYFYKF